MKVKKTVVKNSNISKPKKNLTVILLVALGVISLSLGLFFAISRIFQTETYYVLNTDIPAKTQITPSMLIPQETSKGTGPKNAISMGDLQEGTLYSKYSLFSGDVIASSNAGTITNNYDGIPDDWTVISFTATADNAVDGKLTRGDYFDVIGVNPEGSTTTGGRYLVTSVLCLDVNVSSGGEVQTAEDGTVTTNNSGANLVYTVGIPRDLASSFLGSLPNYEEIHLARSPIKVHYEELSNEDLQDLSSIDGSTEVLDLFEGTDPTFAPVLRDSKYRPVNEDTCKDGKADADICEASGLIEKSTENTTNSTSDSE